MGFRSEHFHLWQTDTAMEIASKSEPDRWLAIPADEGKEISDWHGIHENANRAGRSHETAVAFYHEAPRIRRLSQKLRRQNPRVRYCGCLVDCQRCRGTSCQ
jgi:hypothetical protein